MPYTNVYIIEYIDLNYIFDESTIRTTFANIGGRKTYNVDYLVDNLNRVITEFCVYPVMDVFDQVVKPLLKTKCNIYFCPENDYEQKKGENVLTDNYVVLQHRNKKGDGITKREIGEAGREYGSNLPLPHYPNLQHTGGEEEQEQISYRQRENARRVERISETVRVLRQQINQIHNISQSTDSVTDPRVRNRIVDLVRSMTSHLQNPANRAEADRFIRDLQNNRVDDFRLRNFIRDFMTNLYEDELNIYREGTETLFREYPHELKYTYESNILDDIHDLFKRLLIVDDRFSSDKQPGLREIHFWGIHMSAIMYHFIRRETYNTNRFQVRLCPSYNHPALLYGEMFEIFEDKYKCVDVYKEFHDRLDDMRAAKELEKFDQTQIERFFAPGFWLKKFDLLYQYLWKYTITSKAPFSPYLMKVPFTQQEFMDQLDTFNLDHFEEFLITFFSEFSKPTIKTGYQYWKELKKILERYRTVDPNVFPKVRPQTKAYLRSYFMNMRFQLESQLDLPVTENNPPTREVQTAIEKWYIRKKLLELYPDNDVEFFQGLFCLFHHSNLAIYQGMAILKYALAVENMTSSSRNLSDDDIKKKLNIRPGTSFEQNPIELIFHHHPGDRDIVIIVNEKYQLGDLMKKCFERRSQLLYPNKFRLAMVYNTRQAKHKMNYDKIPNVLSLRERMAAIHRLLGAQLPQESVYLDMSGGIRRNNLENLADAQHIRITSELFHVLENAVRNHRVEDVAHILNNRTLPDDLRGDVFQGWTPEEIQLYEHARYTTYTADELLTLNRIYLDESPNEIPESELQEIRDMYIRLFDTALNRTRERFHIEYQQIQKVYKLLKLKYEGLSMYKSFYENQQESIESMVRNVIDGLHRSYPNLSAKVVDEITELYTQMVTAARQEDMNTFDKAFQRLSEIREEYF
jgi:hypothetical protein